MELWLRNWLPEMKKGASNGQNLLYRIQRIGKPLSGIVSNNFGVKLYVRLSTWWWWYGEDYSAESERSPECVAREMKKVFVFKHCGSGVHFGMIKTLKIVRERFFWLIRRKDVAGMYPRSSGWCASCKGPMIVTCWYVQQYYIDVDSPVNLLELKPKSYYSKVKE